MVKGAPNLREISLNRDWRSPLDLLTSCACVCLVSNLLCLSVTVSRVFTSLSKLPRLVARYLFLFGSMLSMFT